METLTMKKTLFVLCLLFTSAAFAQVGGSRSTEPSFLTSPNHPAQAAYAPMSQERSVLGSGSYTSAQGERPVSDFPQPEPVPLGTSARELKKQHAELKKSRVVWVNQ
jgi:hypothetical protein